MAENSKIDDGGAAFPGMAADGHPDYRPGLTKRDYFAAAALTGICANSYTPWSPNVADITDGQIAQAAFELADALIAASNTGGHHG
jgi:hypothetical protein